MLRKALLSLVLVGTTAAFLCEVHRALSTYDARESRAAGAIAWQFGIPQVERLHGFLRAARPALAPGEAVLFTSPDDAPGQRFFRYRWAAFLLPEVELLPLDDPGRSRARLLLHYGPRIVHPRLRLVRHLPGGQLYQVQP